MSVFERDSAGSAYTTLLPWPVRERRFKLARLGRRSLEPDHVYAFLDRVAADMAVLAASRGETALARLALLGRQSERARGSQR